MLNHYQIIEVTTMGTSAVSRVNVQTITCTSEEYEDKVKPLYHKLAQCTNKYYSVVGSNKKVHYESYIIFGYSIEDAITKVNNLIKYGVKDINRIIDDRNRVCKRANRLCNRELDDNLMENIKEIDYLYIG